MDARRCRRCKSHPRVVWWSPPRRENGSAMMSAVVSNGLSPAAPARRELSLEELSHIPGTDGWPVVGSTFSLLADPKGAVERRAAQYGRVYRTLAFGVRTVALLGPEANEFVLFDSTKLFSSMQGWNWLLERLFPRGLMLLDFDEHRLHRKALSVAFKSGPMKSYLDSLNRGIARGRRLEEGLSGHSVLSSDQATHPRSRRRVLPRRGDRIGLRAGQAGLRRHGGGDCLRRAEADSRHADGARREGPRLHGRLFRTPDRRAARERRRRHLHPALQGDDRRRRAAFEAGNHRPYEFSHDGGA